MSVSVEPLEYEVRGTGPTVVLLAAAGTPGRVWHTYQVPALVRAGFRTVTFDHRPAPALAGGPPGRQRVADLSHDVARMIEHLAAEPVALVAMSFGGVIAQELLCTHPELVAGCAFVATTARLDAFRRSAVTAHQDLVESGVCQPPSYRAVTLAQRYLSPHTLDNEFRASVWLETFTRQPPDEAAAYAQLLPENFRDRRAELAQVTCRCLVVAFADDRVAPPHLCRELADAIPGCDYLELPRCGHLGYLERPRDLNRTLVDFLRAGAPRPAVQPVSPVPDGRPPEAGVRNGGTEPAHCPQWR